MLRERRDTAWFSRLLRHPARKQSGSILTTPEPARGAIILAFFDPGTDSKFQGESFSGGAKYTGMGKFCDFQQKALEH